MNSHLSVLDTKLKSAKSLFIRCSKWVGDIVMATPVFECFRNNFPDAQIIAGIRPYAPGIIEDGPWFDHIVTCRDKDFSGFMQTVQKIRHYRPNGAVLLPNSVRSFLSAKLGGAGSTI